MHLLFWFCQFCSFCVMQGCAVQRCAAALQPARSGCHAIMCQNSRTARKLFLRRNVRTHEKTTNSSQALQKSLIKTTSATHPNRVY
jgi:hypothetical protein